MSQSCGGKVELTQFTVKRGTTIDSEGFHWKPSESSGAPDENIANYVW